MHAHLQNKEIMQCNLSTLLNVIICVVSRQDCKQILWLNRGGEKLQQNEVGIKHTCNTLGHDGVAALLGFCFLIGSDTTTTNQVQGRGKKFKFPEGQ